MEGPQESTATQAAPAAPAAPLSDEEILQIGQAVWDAGELFAELLGAVQALEWKCIDSDQDPEIAELARVVTNLGARIRTQALASKILEPGQHEFHLGALLLAANRILAPGAIRIP